MKIVEIKRIEQTEEVTIGSLLVDGAIVCWVLEEPWRENESGISCIPAGEYPLELEYSPSKNRELWTIKNVPGRSYVRIHIGNTVDDTEGCPLTGSKIGWLHGKRAVLESRVAFDKFMEKMEGADSAKIYVSAVV